MAAKRQSSRRKLSKTTTSTRKRTIGSSSHTWDEVIAIILLGSGLLYFLALISYTPDDLPSWVSFSTGYRPPSEIGNFIGPLGALVAGYSYFFLGAACFLLPACFVWFGAGILMKYKVLTLRTMGGLAAILISGASLADLQTMFLQNWRDDYNIASPGGVVGYGLGKVVLVNTVGKVGSVILMGVVYLVSLILITGIHPFHFMGIARKGLQDRFAQWKEKRKLTAALAGAKAAAGSPAKSLRRTTAARKATAAEEAADLEPDQREEFEQLEFVPQLPAMETREPRIIDASVRTASDGKSKKPSLAELMADRRKERAEHCSPEAVHYPDYQLPDLDLLDFGDDEVVKPANKDHLIATQNVIIDTLATFGIQVIPGDITRGPTITRFEIYPGTGLRVNRITALEADIARATKAERINIIAPIPGKDTVGIEIANSKKVVVHLRELLEDDIFCSKSSRIPLALGKDVYGKTIVGDLAQMPHLLVAGATGSGKSVCINSIITSILYRFAPDELRFILIDPKVVEMQLYNSLPHLVIPVVTDPKKVLLALRWVVNEMERRYRMFASVDVRDFDSFNSREERKEKAAMRKTTRAKAADMPAKKENSEEMVVHAVLVGGSEDSNDDGTASNSNAGLDEEVLPDRIPYIVVIIDELADLMQTAPVEVEGAIQRIAQKARAAGIHLILATQTPRKEVITGNIKTNVPTRIAFQVPSKIDSRVILDASGADKLVGKGDMLYLPPGTSTLLRAQGAYVTDHEVQRVVKFCAQQRNPSFEDSIQESLESAEAEESEVSPEDEEIIEKCIEVIHQEKRASTSLLQRRLRLGYTRAARMIDILEERGIIGPGDGAKPREILVDLDAAID